MCMEEGRMVSILLLEEEYINRKDALYLKPKVALSQILSPQLVHEPLCHIGSSRNNRHPWALMIQKIYIFSLSKNIHFFSLKKYKFPAHCLSSYSSSGMVQSDRVADKGVFKKIRKTKKAYSEQALKQKE